MCRGTLLGAVLVVLIMVLLQSGMAQDWSGVATNRFFILLPSGAENPSQIAQDVEAIFTQVIGLWFPQGLQEGSAWQSDIGPSQIIAIYQTRERMEDELEEVGYDIYFIPQSMDYPQSWKDAIPTTPRYSSLSSTSPIAVASLVNDDWRAPLALGMAYVLENKFWLVLRPELVKKPYRLLLWGMPLFTAYALGYEKALDFYSDKTVSAWLSLGGDLSNIPYFLRGNIAVSMVQDLCNRADPTEVFNLFFPIFTEKALQAGDFDSAFVGSYGISWEEFLAEWKNAVKAQAVTPQALAYYEAKRRELQLRFRYLYPLLSRTQRSEIEDALTRLHDGEGKFCDIDKIEATFAALGELSPTQEILGKLTLREKSLGLAVGLRRGKEISREVERLAGLRIDDPQGYIREYVRIVNSYLPWKGYPAAG